MSAVPSPLFLRKIFQTYDLGLDHFFGIRLSDYPIRFMKEILSIKSNNWA